MKQKLFFIAMLFAAMAGCVACSEDEKKNVGSIDVSTAAIAFNQLGLTSNGELFKLSVKSSVFWVANIEIDGVPLDESTWAQDGDGVSTGTGLFATNVVKEWVMLSPRAGTGEMILQIKGKTNNTADIRTATLVLTPYEGSPVRIPLTQNNDREEVKRYLAEDMGRAVASYSEINHFDQWAKIGMGSFYTAYHGTAMVDSEESSAGMYRGASGGNNIVFAGDDSTNFMCGKIETRDKSRTSKGTIDDPYRYVEEFNLSFGVYAEHRFSANEFKLYVSPDATTWKPVTVQCNAGHEGPSWGLASAKFRTLKALTDTTAESLKEIDLMFNVSVPDIYRMDDITLTEGTAGAGEVITF
jgi:hypothetical protein